MNFRFLLLMLGSFILVLALFVILTGGGFGTNSRTGPLEINKITFIAHRGLYNYYAENSLEGYERCEEMGFDAIETDIRVTKDRHLIVFHDDSTSRLLKKHSLIEQLNYADLDNYNLHFHGTPTQNKVLSLDLFLQNFKQKFTIYLDNKVNKKWVADSLVMKLKIVGAENSVIIASSNLLFLAYIKYKDKNLYTVLEGFDAGKEWIFHFIPKYYKPDYYSSFMSKVNEEQINFLRKNNILDRKIVYGVDSSNVNAVLKAGIQHMIIDFDSSLTSLLHEHL